MTESEAKTKWCFRLVVDEQMESARPQYGADPNPPGEHGLRRPTGNCIGSACMAWRENHPVPITAMGRNHDGTTWEHETPAGEKRGWCGLAGNY